MRCPDVDTNNILATEVCDNWIMRRSRVHSLVIIIIIYLLFIPFLAHTGAWAIHETFRFTSVS
jgi:hypothetical protein